MDSIGRRPRPRKAHTQHCRSPLSSAQVFCQGAAKPRVGTIKDGSRCAGGPPALFPPPRNPEADRGERCAGSTRHNAWAPSTPSTRAAHRKNRGPPRRRSPERERGLSLSAAQRGRGPHTAGGANAKGARASLETLRHGCGHVLVANAAPPGGTTRAETPHAPPQRGARRCACVWTADGVIGAMAGRRGRRPLAAKHAQPLLATSSGGRPPLKSGEPNAAAVEATACHNGGDDCLPKGLQSRFVNSVLIRCCTQTVIVARRETHT